MLRGVRFNGSGLDSLGFRVYGGSNSKVAPVQRPGTIGAEITTNTILGAPD